MLWYKAWLETRWRFVTGLVLGAGFAALVVLAYPTLGSLQVDVSQVPGPFRRMAEEGLALVKDYDGYVWSQWFGKNLLNVWTFFAVLVGVGGVVTETSRGTALWTLALPATRARLLGVRAAVGALELLALALVPSLLIPALSPVIGKTYPLASALIYAATAFAGGLAFYGLSLLLSTVFADQLKPVIVGLGVAFGLSLASLFSKSVARYSVFSVMSGEKYFREGALPWAGLAACLGIAAASYLVALRVLERRDF
jgi:ABC-2 type transport system permease protein